MFKKGCLSGRFAQKAKRMARDTATNFLTASIIITTFLCFYAGKDEDSAFKNLKDAAASASIGNAFRLACSGDMRGLVEVTLPAYLTPFSTQNTLSWENGIPLTLGEINSTKLTESNKRNAAILNVRFSALIERIKNLRPYETDLFSLNTTGGSTLHSMRAAHALQNTNGHIIMYAQRASSGGTILAFAVQDPDRNLFLEPDAHLSYPMIMERISDILKRSTNFNMPLSDQDIESFGQRINKYMSGSDGIELPNELLEILEPYRKLIRDLSEPCEEMFTLNSKHIKYAYGLSTEDLVRIFGGIILLEINPDGSMRALVREGSPFDIKYKSPAVTQLPAANPQ